MLGLFDVNIAAIDITMKGFNNSIGWNLGKKIRSNHLLDPFTSIPIKGTKSKSKRQTTNKKIEIFNRISLLIEEKKKIKRKAKKI